MPSVFESAFFYFYDSPGLIFLTSTTGKDVRVEQEIWVVLHLLQRHLHVLFFTVFQWLGWFSTRAVFNIQGTLASV